MTPARAAAMRAVWATPDAAKARAAAISEGLRRAWADPEKAKRMRDAAQTPEAIEARRLTVVARLEDPEYRARLIAHLRAVSPRKRTPEFIAAARRLWDARMPVKEIAARLGVSVSVINGISERNDFPSRARVMKRMPA